MKILDFFKPCDFNNIVCLGRFDGLHLGHKSLLYKGLEIKNNASVSCKLSIFCFQKSEAISRLDSIYTFRETIYKLKDEPVDNVIVASECKEFFEISKEDFLNILLKNFKPITLVCGEDYRFGHNKEGNVDYLKTFCYKHNINLVVVPTYKINGEKVSTSKIKEYLRQGNIPMATRLLGESYFIQGTVVKGRGDGHKIGYPTCNINIPPEKTPVKEGVYASFILLDGQLYPSVTNYGCAPTFGSTLKTVETHILSFNGDLYGKEITVILKRYLRENIKFDNVKQLQNQLEKDIKSL